MRWLVLVLLLCACEDKSSATTVRNECLPATPSCTGRNSRCDNELLACVRTRVEESYELRVRVTPENTSLGDAGADLVPQAVFLIRETFTEELDAEVLRVPEAEKTEGAVHAEIDGKAKYPESELVIAPIDPLVPLAPRVVAARFNSTPGDGRVEQLTTFLDPEQRYSVHVQPLLDDSNRLPPLDFEVVAPGTRFDIDYGEVQPVIGQLLSRDETFGAVRPDRVRLQDKSTGRVVSSTARVDAEGRFTLYAEAEVVERADFDLTVSLIYVASGESAVEDFRLDPWQLTISIDGPYFLAKGTLRLPQAPEPKPQSARVEKPDEQDGEGAAPSSPLLNADLLFLSSYPLPPPENGSPTPEVGGTDWCRWEEPIPIKCNGRFLGRSNDQDGKYQVALIPGNYEVVVLPRAEEFSARGTRVTKRAETPMNKPNSFVVTVTSELFGPTLAAKLAQPYRGTIFSAGLRSPNVTVHAHARPTPGPTVWGDLASYNRTLSATTDARGEFTLYTDIGYYDFVVEAAEDSGYAWKLWLDCPSAPEAPVALAPIRMPDPVMVRGVVESERGVKLANARIEAFAVVGRSRRDQRTILIGRTTSDEDGRYALALPPRVGESFGPDKCESKAFTVPDSAR